MLSLAPPQNFHRTKEEYVYDTLRTAITRCELEPGERLVIDSLKSSLGVSPIPIRSALQRLEAEGFVEITPHTGAIVSEISLEIVTEIFLLLESLENIAFSVAASRAIESDLAHLRQLLEEMETAFKAGNPDHWYDLNNKFHLAVAQMSHMKMLIRFTKRALDSRDRLRHFYMESFINSRMSVAHDEHCRMIELLESRDVDRLTTLVTQHNRRAKEAYQQLIEKQQVQ